MAEINVGIHCTVIPDGFSSSTGRARLSLVLTPDTRNPTLGVSVNLRNWPEEITRLASNLVVAIQLADGTTREYSDVVVDAALKGNDAVTAGNLWRDIFNHPVDGFPTLQNILAESHQPPKIASAFAPQLTPNDDISKAFADDKDKFVVKIHRHEVDLQKSNWVQTHYLAELLQSLYDDTQFLKLASLFVAHETRMAAIGPTRLDPHRLAESFSRTETGRALGLEDATWINSLASMYVDRPFRQTLLASFRRHVLSRLLDADIGAPPGDAFGALQHLPSDSRVSVRAELLDEQQAAVQRSLLGIIGEARLIKNQPSPPPSTDFVQPRGKGRDMMRAVIGDVIRKQTGAPAAPMSDYRSQAAKNFQAFHRHWQNSQIGAKDIERLATKSEADNLDDVVRRKFFGIRSQPTLAKFLRLIIDVEVEPEKLEKFEKRDLSTAWFSKVPHTPQALDAELAASSIKPDFVAYQCKTDENRYFRPCGQRDHRTNAGLPASLSPPINNGVVDLHADARFELVTLNISNSVGALRMQAEQNEGAQRDGTLLDTVSTKLPERQARGLQLIDHGVMGHMVAGLAMGRVAAPGNPNPKGTETNPYFAEDLAIGYRPFIQRWKHGEQPVEKDEQVTNGREWRSLVARAVSIDALRAVDQKQPYLDVRRRDHGLVRVAHKLIGAGAGNPPATASTDQQMFAWMGASLALSTDVRTSTSAEEGTDAAPGANPGVDEHWPGEDPKIDLALAMTYSFSDKPEDKQPALRTGDSYFLGLAAVYPNGGGPSLNEVTRAFNARGKDEIVVLGVSSANSAVVPFKFGPPHDTPAPGILVSQNEALQWRKHEKPAPKSKSSDTVNRGGSEQVERIVLRSASKPAGDKDVALRYLVPPRATFERAEQAGMFDHVFEARPPGAFSGYALDEERGNFITDGESTRQPAPNPLLKPEPAHERSRPAVLLPRASAHQPRAGYYPDPLARNLRVRFERSGAVPVGFPDDLPIHAFWKSDASPVTAQPIELLIRRWSEGRAGGRVNFGDTKGSIKGGGVTRHIDRLAIEIAPAEEVNLRIWCVPDGYDLLRRRSDLQVSFKSIVLAAAQELVRGAAFDPLTLEQYIESLADGVQPQQAIKQLTIGPDVAAAAQEAFSRLFSALLLQTPDNGINAWMTLNVVHAVEKPLAVPVIPIAVRPRLVDGVWRDVPLLAVQPVRLKRNTTWEDYAATLDPADLPSALDLPSGEEGTTTYFVGQIEFDRASTGELRVEASWPEFDPSVSIRRVEKSAATKTADDPLYEFCPLKRDRLLFSDPIRVPREGGTNPEGRIDLTFNETGSLRGLNFPFSDTAARELSLRVIATSRFVNDFPASDADTKQEKDALGRFDVETRPPTGSKRMHEAPAESYRTYKLMVPASASPPLPVVTRIEWIMPEKLTDFEPGRRICVEKQFYPRLYLGRDWFASGEHELLAVVCAPGDLVSDRPYSPESKPPPVLDPMPLSAMEALLAPKHRDIPASAFSKDKDALGKPGILSLIADFVSRWGSDPTVRSTPLTGTITRERFSGFIAAASNVPLPNDSTQKISLLLYKPIFDPYRGEFYVDIGIDPGPAHGPMIQLAIARYQPYTIDPRFHLSSITTVRPFQVAPKRTVEVIIHDDKHIRTIVQGVGYTNRNPEVPGSLGPSLPEEYASVVRYPLQNIRLILLDNNKATSGIQVYNERGKPLQNNRVKPQFFHPELIWISEFQLPQGPNQYRYGLEFDEIDVHFADEAYEKDAPAGSGIVERPSRFSLTIDLDRGLFSPTEQGPRPPIQAYSQIR